MIAATDVLSGDTGPGELCPSSTWHTACQPLLLGQETSQTQPPSCQDQKGPSRDQLHLPRQGHPVTQVCLECLQTGSSSHSLGSLVQRSATLNKHCSPAAFSKKKPHHRHIPGASSPSVACQGLCHGPVQAPPEPKGDPRSCAATDATEAATPVAPGSGRGGDTAVPSARSPRCPLTSCF